MDEPTNLRDGTVRGCGLFACSPMALFYFVLILGLRTTDDHEGQEHPDWTSARAAAVRAARSIMASDVLEGCLDLNGRIQVTNNSDGSTEEVVFRDAVEFSP